MYEWMHTSIDLESMLDSTYIAVHRYCSNASVFDCSKSDEFRREPIVKDFRLDFFSYSSVIPVIAYHRCLLSFRSYSFLSLLLLLVSFCSSNHFLSSNWSVPYAWIDIVDVNVMSVLDHSVWFPHLSVVCIWIFSN